LNTLAGRILGSVPLDVARHTPADVLIVRTT
jgi:nucleotide-binding universal stress UspA family protein